MSFWKNLYNGIFGQGVDDHLREEEKATEGIPGAINKSKDKDFREEYNRELYGDQIDDFMRDKLGKETWYDREARIENDRYWADYYKNTGIDPKDVKYPIRAGVNMNNAGDRIPGMAITTGKRAITELYGGQK